MTYAELKESLQNSETTFVADLPTIIKQAEERILKLVRLPVFRRNVQGNLTTGNQYLGTPSDFMDTFSIATITSDTYNYLIRTDVSFIREAYPTTTTTSAPKHYALFDDSTYIVGPTPNSDYTTELHYFYRPASITSAGESGTTWLSTNATNALLYGCLVEGYTYMKGEADLMNLYNQRYQEALGRLKVLGEGRNTTDTYREGSFQVPVT